VAKLNLILLAVLVAACGALAGCATQLQVPEKVNVPVPVACVDPKDVPPRPQLRTQDDLMGMDRYRRTLAAWSDLVKLWAYTTQLESIAAGCSKIPARAAGP